jgi:hypothetical protein
MRRLGIVAVGLALVLALAACTRTVEKVVLVTASPAGTPTLTVEESAYLEAVATVESEATAEALVHARETVAAMPTGTPRPTLTPVPPPYKLALISAACNREYDFIVCEGFVQNISGELMESIEAVALFFDDVGTPITSDSALIDYDPLLASQQSPFSIYATYNPAISKWRIEFKEFFGGTILTRDDRQ